MRLNQFFKILYRIKFIAIFVVFIFFIPQSTFAIVKAGDLFSSEFNHVDFIDDPLGMAYASDFGLTTGGSEKIDLRNIIVNIVKYILSFTGIVAVSMIMVGGFKFMIAGGSTDTLASAKSYILNGVIGLVIIVTSYTIVGTIVSTVESLISGSFVDKFS